MKYFMIGFIFGMSIFIALMCSFIKYDQAKTFKELEDLNSTLQYIDNRMDTLEFFRIPEQYKK